MRPVDVDTGGCASADDLVLAHKVEAMTGYGLSASEIACVLEIEEDALLANYGHQLRAGPIKANARVAESLYRKALGDDRQAVTAAIFWLKTRASWKETSFHEMEGKVDTTVTCIITCDDQRIL